jgi:cytochrome c5
MSDTTHEEAHTGPIRTPGQLLLAVFFSFVIPIFGVIGLVYYVVSQNKPAGDTSAEHYSLGGVSAQDHDRGVMARIQKIGMVEIRDANRPLKSGEEVFKAQCTTCHTAGVLGAPKFGDAAAWAPRIRTGFEALWNSALHGKNAMPPQGGGDFDDIEVGRAVVYMANAAGATFTDPQRPAAPATIAAASAAAMVPVATAIATAGTAAAAAPAAPVAVVAATTQVVATSGGGEALYKQVCFACHAAGVAGAPKFGDKAAWAPRIAQGVPQLVQSALHGKGAMPPKGGSAASEAEIRATVEYMVNAAK